MKVFVSIFLLLFLLSGCVEKPIEGDVSKLFGYWKLSKIVYSNSTYSYRYSPNYQVYHFTSEYVTNRDGISNYLGFVYEISSFVVTNNVISNVWGLDLKLKKLYLYGDLTNYVYVFAFVANNSDNINEVWLSDGVITVSGSNYNFFATNGIVRYVLEKM